MPKYSKYLYAVYVYGYIAANHMCILQAFVVQVNFRQAWFKSNFSIFVALFFFTLDLKIMTNIKDFSINLSSRHLVV